jgi:hypothetical protein
MSEVRTMTPYEAPQLRELGRVSVLTAYDGGGLHFAQATLGSLAGAAPTPHGGGEAPVGSQGVLGETQSGGSPAAPGGSGVEAVSVPGSGAPGSGVAGAGPAVVSENGVSGSLPFTGYLASQVAALGAGLTAAGATLRRWARRA